MTDRRLLETGDLRLLETGDYRLLEGGSPPVPVASQFPTLIVEAAFGANPGDEYLLLDDTSRGLLDTGRLADGTIWIDISAWVRRIRTKRGKMRSAEHHVKGWAQIELDNQDQRFSPWNLSGPYVAAGITQLQPNRRIRVRATDPNTGITHAVWAGSVDAYTPRLGTPSGSTCTITASGPFKILARHDPLAERAERRRRDLGARLGRLLDLIGWPSGDRDIDVGESTVQATSLAQNVLGEAYLVADSEAGELTETADGKTRFRGRHAVYESERSITVQATFGDDPDSAELLYESLDVPAFDDALVNNVVSAAVAGGTARTATDSTSIGRHWEKTYRRFDLIGESGDDATGWAARRVYERKDAEQRIDGVQLATTGKDAALWPAILGLDFRDLVRVVRRVEGGDALDRLLHVERIEHEVVPGIIWETTLGTSSATPFLGFLLLDDTSRGLLDTGTLAPY